METRMDDDRMERAERLAPEIAHAGDGHEVESGTTAASATPAGEPNVIHTTSPYAPDDIKEGETFDQHDVATLRARNEGDRLIR